MPFSRSPHFSTASFLATVAVSLTGYLSWMLYHSGLGENDGVLLGASKVGHLKENLACCSAAAPLPEEVQIAFDKAWKITKPDAFAFWRGYSLDMPGKDDMDPGATYVAGGKK